MSEFEHELRAFAAAIEVPPTPDLAARVRAELGERRPVLWRRRLAVALSLAAIAIGAAFAVPQARTAILRFFGVGSVRIEFVKRLPKVPAGPIPLGRRVEPDAAPFPPLSSKLLGRPNGVYVQGNVVTMLYGTRSSVRLLVTLIHDSMAMSEVAKKLAVTGTQVRFLAVGRARAPGVWVEGAPHIVRFPGGPLRLARNALIWRSGALTVRVEGTLRLDDALAIADSLR